MTAEQGGIYKWFSARGGVMKSFLLQLYLSAVPTSAKVRNGIIRCQTQLRQGGPSDQTFSSRGGYL